MPRDFKKAIWIALFSMECNYNITLLNISLFVQNTVDINYIHYIKMVNIECSKIEYNSKEHSNERWANEISVYTMSLYQNYNKWKRP